MAEAAQNKTGASTATGQGEKLWLQNQKWARKLLSWGLPWLFVERRPAVAAVPFLGSPSLAHRAKPSCIKRCLGPWLFESILAGRTAASRQEAPVRRELSCRRTNVCTRQHPKSKEKKRRGEMSHPGQELITGLQASPRGPAPLRHSQQGRGKAKWFTSSPSPQPADVSSL